MSRELLTIVIPTRDRPDFLAMCLRSVFERQSVIPHVIVSDNSTVDHPSVRELQQQYGFTYIRQSGELSQTEHLNRCCLELPLTPWVLMLHDDDELYPDSMHEVVSFLVDGAPVGLIVGGIQLIDQGGRSRKVWMPESGGIMRGEEGLLRLGLHWQARWPGMILNVAASRQVCGFVDVDGRAGDYIFAIRLAYRYGVAFFPQLVGRYRIGPQQATDVLSPAKAEEYLDFSVRQAELLWTLGCSKSALDRLLDYITWWTFLGIAPQWLPSHPSFVFRLAHTFARRSPTSGPWQTRVQQRYPFLFWRPHCLAPLFLRVAQSLPRPLKRLARRRRQVRHVPQASIAR
ncbi:MAG: glycosyltransferase family 2 protein [Candidatus Entotheonellia bacterium]